MNTHGGDLFPLPVEIEASLQRLTDIITEHSALADTVAEEHWTSRPPIK
jgi:hypothetical protein